MSEKFSKLTAVGEGKPLISSTYKKNDNGADAFTFLLPALLGRQTEITSLSSVYLYFKLQCDVMIVQQAHTLWNASIL